MHPRNPMHHPPAAPESAELIPQQHCPVLPETAGERLDLFLSHSAGISRSRAQRLIAEGSVTLDSVCVDKPSRPVAPGEVYTLFIAPTPVMPGIVPVDIPLVFLYQDDHIAVIDKPAGMVVHPGQGTGNDTLAAALLHRCRSVAGVGDDLRPGIVHRLDRDTSGIMVVALSALAHERLSDMIRRHEISRQYIAYVWGQPLPSEGTIDAPIGRHPRIGTKKAVVTDGRQAVTHYTTLTPYSFLSKLAVRLETGRTHQIRVHLASIGHHVFGDPVYGGREERLGGFDPSVRAAARRLLSLLDRQALHASRLTFSHPITGEALSLEAALPPDLVELERALDALNVHR